MIQEAILQIKGRFPESFVRSSLSYIIICPSPSEARRVTEYFTRNYWQESVGEKLYPVILDEEG